MGIVPLLGKINASIYPTLLLNGEIDVNYPPELTNLSIKYLPNALAEVVGNASNMVHVDQPERTAALLKEFIRANDGKKRNHEIMSELPYLVKLYQALEDKKRLRVRIDFLTVFKMKV